MKPVYFSFSLNASSVNLNSPEEFECVFQKYLKPVAVFLYSHQKFCLSFNFNGPLLQFLHKKHPEFIKILQELTARKQIEVLGNGYYNPVFPLLFPTDQTGQIDLYSSEVRQAFGKRPRGMNLCASSWDSSLLSVFDSCSMEYVLLDEIIIPPEKNVFIPLFMSDKGKYIDILPVMNSLKPDMSVSPQSFVKTVKTQIEHAVKKSSIPSVEQLTSNTGIHIQFTPWEFNHLLNSLWFDSFLDLLDEETCCVTSGSYIKICTERVPVYVSAGIGREVCQWALKPYKAMNVSGRFPTIHDFLQLYPQSHALYDRMLYLSLLVNQCHGDKIRKKAAREKMWEAQNGAGFVCTSTGAFVNSTYRQKAYKCLSEAEKILRQCNDFKESLVSFDYNCDGLKEYVCRMQNYFAVASLKGGVIRELDIMQNSGNYADNLSRIAEFEGVNDEYERGLFVDRLFTENEFNDYLQNKPCGSGIFSKKLYSEVKVSGSHKEVLLSASAMFKNRQKISLRKKILAFSSGLMIQYILKNESESPLKAVFAVESSFAQTNFDASDFNAFKLEIISDGQKKEIDTKSSSLQMNESGKISDVEGFQLTDTDNSISFMFMPNESCGLSFTPIVFRRPDYFTGDSVPASMTFSNAMHWDVNLEPGMEMEKTINFSIFNQHKK